MYITERIPWKDNMGGVPLHLEYPQGSMFDAVREVAEKYPPKRSAAKNLFMLPYGMHSSKRTNVWNTYLQEIMASLDNPEPECKSNCRYEKSPALARLG